MLYENGLRFNLSYFEMYEMTLKELEETIIKRKEGLGYFIWRLASLTRSPYISNFPETPEEACPELFDKKDEPTIEMPDFLKNKTYKFEGGVMKYE